MSLYIIYIILYTTYMYIFICIIYSWLVWLLLIPHISLSAPGGTALSYSLLVCSPSLLFALSCLSMSQLMHNWSQLQWHDTCQSNSSALAALFLFLSFVLCLLSVCCSVYSIRTVCDIAIWFFHALTNSTIVTRSELTMRPGVLC